MAYSTTSFNIPDYPLAGQRASTESLVVPGQPVGVNSLIRRTERDGNDIHIHPSNRLNPLTGTGEESAYKVINGYLIPDYQNSRTDSEFSNGSLFNGRIKKFLELIKKGRNYEVSGAALDAEIVDFDRRLASINQHRQSNGQGEFSISSDSDDWSKSERDLVSEGGFIVGHAVNRLARLGNVILEAERLKLGVDYTEDNAKQLIEFVKRENLQDVDPDDELLIEPNGSILKEGSEKHIERLMAKISNDFLRLHKTLTDNKHETMVRCLLTRDGYADHDGQLHNLIREMGKPLLFPIEHFRNNRLRSLNAELANAKTEEESSKIKLIIDKIHSTENNFESSYRKQIITEIGDCIGAIDETYEAMQTITSHPFFSGFISRNVRRLKSDPNAPRVNELPLEAYRDTLQEYVDLSRARACIRHSDTDNFNPIVKRWSMLEAELKLYHEQMTSFATMSGKTTAINSINLLKRGVGIISEMAELRLPRNRHSTTIYDQGMLKASDFPDDSNVPESDRLTDKEKEDMSTVGRFKRKVWLLAHNQLRQQGVEI